MSIVLQANQTDVYVSGPLLSAYKECIVGPPELMNPPPWLNYSFGPVVSIDSGSSTSVDSASSSSSPVTGGTASTTGAATTASSAGGGSVFLNSIPSGTSFRLQTFNYIYEILNCWGRIFLLVLHFIRYLVHWFRLIALRICLTESTRRNVGRICPFNSIS